MRTFKLWDNDDDDEVVLVVVVELSLLSSSTPCAEKNPLDDVVENPSGNPRRGLGTLTLAEGRREA